MVKKISKIVFVVSMVLLIIDLKRLYANDNLNIRDEINALLPFYDIDNEDKVRSEDELKTYIEECVCNEERIRFYCMEEVVEARMFGYVNKKGKIAYKCRRANGCFGCCVRNQ